MNLRQYAKKLRDTANAIDDLFAEEPTLNVAVKIRKALRKNPDFILDSPIKKARWNQTPAGRKAQSKRIKKFWKDKKAGQK